VFNSRGSGWIFARMPFSVPTLEAIRVDSIVEQPDERGGFFIA